MKILQDGQAAVEDEIVADEKNGGEVMIDWLLQILQQMWKTKQLPSE